MDDIYDLYAYYYGFEMPEFSPAEKYHANLSRLYLYYQFEYLSLQDWCFEMDWC